VILIEDLTGKKFGQWEVLYYVIDKTKSRGARWYCRCSCGTERSVLGKYLKNGSSTSCGCTRKVDWVGRRIGRLTILSVYEYDGDTYCMCKCDCGNEVAIKKRGILGRHSCGCRLYEATGNEHTIDLTGQKFGRLFVKSMKYTKGSLSECECLCDCGNVIVVPACRLTSGNTTSCGCIHSPSLIGNTYGRLTVVEEAGRKGTQKLWKCICECGNETYLTSHILASGHTNSCGCLRSEKVSRREVMISEILSSMGIKYISEKSFDDLKGVGNKSLRFDFFVPSINTVIEYDGMQHFIPIQYFGGETHYNRQKENDLIKDSYCDMNGIRLLRLPYTLTDDQIYERIVALF
jgi:hypothetical protein